MAKHDNASETEKKADASRQTDEKMEIKEETGNKSTEVEVKDEVKETGSKPETKDTSKEIDIKEEKAKTTEAGSKDETGEVKKETDSKDETVEVKKETDSKDETVEVKKETDSKETGEVKKETDSKDETEVKKETDSKDETGQVKKETSKDETGEVKKETDSKVEPVDAKKETGSKDKPVDAKKETDSKDKPLEGKTEEEAMDTTEAAENTDSSVKQKEVKKEEESKGDSQKTDEKKIEVKATELESKIIRQVEYYFGDVNLGRDQFLQGQIKEDNGWVKMEIMFKFNRLRQLSEDGEVVASALRKSRSGLMEVSEDNTKIRRNPSKPLPVHDKLRREDLKSRSLYVKGFPLDMDLDKLQCFMDKFGQIEHIQRRYDADKKFKGSVFVIFGKSEDAKKFLQTDCVKFEDSELLRLFKDEYFKKKTEEKKSKREEELKDMEDMKEKREEEDKEAFRKKITLGTVLQLKGLPSSNLTVDDLKEKFSEYAEVAWVEYKPGDTDARVRFSVEDKGKETLLKAKEKDGGSIKVKEQEVDAYVLEGDEEIQFWKTLFQEQRDRKDKNRRGRGKRGRGGRGGHGGPPFKRRRTNYD